jgi:hypothetical protein
LVRRPLIVLLYQPQVTDDDDDDDDDDDECRTVHGMRTGIGSEITCSSATLSTTNPI